MLGGFQHSPILLSQSAWLGDRAAAWRGAKPRTEEEGVTPSSAFANGAVPTDTPMTNDISRRDGLGRVKPW